MATEYVVQLYNPKGYEDGGAIFYRRDWAEEWADHHTLESLWRSEITEREAEDEHAALEAACTCTWEDGDSAVCPIHKDEHAELISRDGWEDDGERGRR